METLRQDVRFAFRMMLKNWGLTAAAVVALALGIGANTAIFSVVNAVLLRPLPYSQPDRLMRVWETARGETGTISHPDFKDWREQCSSFEHITAYEYDSFIMTGRGEPERIVGVRASAHFTEMLGIAPAFGRGFLEEEDKFESRRVVILGHGLWKRRFGSDPNLIGQSLTLNNESYMVIGIMPKDFEFPGAGIDLWTPLAIDPKRAEPRGDHYLSVIGRLKSGVDIKQAQKEIDTVMKRIEQQYPDTNTGFGALLEPLHEDKVGDVRPALLVLQIAVGFVLLIACANTATLLLAQATSRQKEIAVRAALGAGRLRLARQFLTESVMLSLMGGGLGLLLTLWGVEFLAAKLPGGIHNAKSIGIDRTVLGFTLAVSVLTGLIFGAAPALQASKPDLNETLKEGGRGVLGSLRRQRLRSALVVSEIALALVLLIGGGLLIRSFQNLQRIDPGFEPEKALTMQISLPPSKYESDQQKIAFYKQALDNAAALPGVEAVGFTTELPFNGSRTRSSFEIDGRPPLPPGESLSADSRTISAGYFSAMGIPVLRGRAFNEGDTQNAPPAAIINEAAARRFWPDEDPIGKRVILNQDIKHEIIGIVGNVKHMKLAADNPTEIYRHCLQSPPNREWMDLAIRSNNPKSLIDAVRKTIRSIDPDQPVYNVKTMDERLSNSIARQRFNAALLALFAAVALILAALGIYGVISYSVTQRSHEIGIRMALGAEAGDVLKLVIGQGMFLVLIGVSVGLAASFILTRLMQSLLYGVKATDPATFLGVSLLLAAVAALACFIPARRATKIDPMIALRYE